MNKIKEFVFKQKIFSKCSADEQKNIIEELNKIEINEIIINLMIDALSKTEKCPYECLDIILPNCEDGCIKDAQGMCWYEYFMELAKGMKNRENK